MIDLNPAAHRMAALLDNVGDGDLELPTPLPGMDVGALIDHIGKLALGFAGVARKTPAGPPVPPSRTNLGPDWRKQIAADLDALGAAWLAPAAWEGMTKAGGIDLPSEIAGLVALDELVVHGWDVAVSSGQAYEPKPEEIEAATGFVASFPLPRDGRLFGPVVEVSADAPALDRLLGLAGRDPGWQPAP
jgi:uncharacterized protein (TIGR03086 family)